MIKDLPEGQESRFLTALATIGRPVEEQARNAVIKEEMVHSMRGSLGKIPADMIIKNGRVVKGRLYLAHAVRCSVVT